MEQFILELVQKYPVLATVLFLIGGLRVIVKPAMAYYEEYVAGTKETADDEKLAKIKASKFYKALVFLLDYTASVKLPK